MWDKKVILELTQAEAIVLQDFVERFNRIKNHGLFEDQAEQRAMWNLECILEQSIDVPFYPGVDNAVNDARDLLRDEDCDETLYNKN